MRQGAGMMLSAYVAHERLCRSCVGHGRGRSARLREHTLDTRLLHGKKGAPMQTNAEWNDNRFPKRGWQPPCIGRRRAGLPGSQHSLCACSLRPGRCTCARSSAPIVTPETSNERACLSIFAAAKEIAAPLESVRFE
jgi:hypothetical protein